MNGRVVWLQRVADRDLESFASNTIAEVRNLVLGVEESKSQSTDLGRGLDERSRIPEIDVLGGNEDVDVRVLHPIREGRHWRWRNVVSDSSDCFFDDHPFARRETRFCAPCLLLRTCNTLRQEDAVYIQLEAWCRVSDWAV